jgi:polyhydroxybutyrate depolymerase
MASTEQSRSKQRGSRQQWLTRAVVLCTFAVLAAACGSAADTVSTADDPTAAAVEAPAETSPPTTQEPAIDPAEEAEPPEPIAVAWPDGPVKARPGEVDCSAIGDVPAGLQTGSITSGGLDYAYQWTVPSSYDGTPLPVVLDFHGLDSTGAQQAEFVGWAALAEAEGFLAVQPEGLPWPDFPRGWEIPQFDTDPGRNDAAMVVDLLEHVAANVCIDPARIYSTGFSMGGIFTSTLVCHLGDVIAAAVSVGGMNHHDACDPTRAVPFLAFHGTDDQVAPFNGQSNLGLPGSPELDFNEQVQPEVFAEFADHFGCTESVDSAESESVTLTSYTGCDADAEVGFYTIDGGGHTWPGSSVFADKAPMLGHTTMEIDALAIAWEFFQRNPLPG